MILWRISNYADLSGVGGVRFSARWHSKGRPIVYTAEHPALALLEILVNNQRANLPNTYQLLRIEAASTRLVDEVSKLKFGWQGDENYTRALGDKWLEDGTSPLMRVPSAIMPHAFNYLINPEHQKSSEIQISKIEDHPFDIRLK